MSRRHRLAVVDPRTLPTEIVAPSVNGPRHSPRPPTLGTSRVRVPITRPPSPRYLVGVETNPGPRKRLANSSHLNGAYIGPASAIQIKSKHPKKTERSKEVLRGPRATRHGGHMSSSTEYLNSYVGTVEDPWEYGPIPLGFGCFTETVLATAYFRGSFTPNADGSFFIAQFPTVAGGIYVNNGPYTTGGAVPYNFSNTAAIQLQGIEGRVVSGGIRLSVHHAATEKSGALVAGVIPSVSTSVLTTYRTSDLFGLAGSELGLDSKGARATILPQDSDSFTFTTVCINGYPATSLSLSSVPYIAGAGYPATATIWYEAILNVEMLPSVSSSSIGVDPTSNRGSDHYATAQQLFDSAKRIMGNTVVMDATLAAGTLVKDYLKYKIRRRSTFNTGTNAMKTRKSILPILPLTPQAPLTALSRDPEARYTDYNVPPRLNEHDYVQVPANNTRGTSLLPRL